MKIQKPILAIVAIALPLGFASCDKFLDTMPDNRTTLDTEQKIVSFLTSAYPSHNIALVTEVMSDNVDDTGVDNPNSDRFLDQVYNWQDVTELNTDDPKSFWEASYKAIATANQALLDIDKLAAEGPLSTTMMECKAEALLCRAYSYFMLVNVFCQNYNAQTSSQDLGVPYTDKPETKLVATYDRGTVAGIYEKIEQDIQAALPIMGDTHYTIPKFHFNEQAAYAFAARFYLFYEQWDKAVEYANLCLGSAPGSMLRNWAWLATLPQDGNSAMIPFEEQYVSADANANLMLCASYSMLGIAFNNFVYYARYTHTPYTGLTEDYEARNIWGKGAQAYHCPPKTYEAANQNKEYVWRYPYFFEETDPVEGTGYPHAVLPLFTADDCLLTRAEAYIMLKQYDKAVADLNLWEHNILKRPVNLTAEGITKFYKSAKYSYEDAKGMNGTIKKHLHPAFAIDEEGSMQECLLQCVLGFKRIENMQTGWRWFDIKRYGIEIVRRTMAINGPGGLVPVAVTDVLTTDDPRRAIQVPQETIQAGLTPNPRHQ